MQRGYTLIELVMVIVIVAILSSVAMVSLAPSSATKVDHARHLMMSDIRAAQELAISTQRRTRIIFSIPSNNYTVEIEPTDNANDWTSATSPFTGGSWVVQLGSGAFAGVVIQSIFFDTAGYALLFETDGTPYNAYPTTPFTASPLAAQGYVALNGNLAVTVQPNTGLVGLAAL